MKKIIKLATNEPESFSNWKSAQSVEGWEPCWDTLGGQEKKDLRKALVQEQGYICCYCQQRITLCPKTEIEHIFPREFCIEDKKYLAIEYNNLIASCEGNQPKYFDKTKQKYERRHEDLGNKIVHCNNFRKSEDLPITPLFDRCEEYFIYTYEGDILTVENNNDAQKSIDNLNLKILNKKRKEYIEGTLFKLDDNFESTGEFVDDFDKNDYLNKFMNMHDIDGDGELKYYEYSGVIVNLLNQLGKKENNANTYT